MKEEKDGAAGDTGDAGAPVVSITEDMCTTTYTSQCVLRMARFLVGLIVPLLAGCVTQTSVDGFQIPAQARESGTFFVQHQPKDERQINRLIENAMRVRGLDASTSTTESRDYVVSYIDLWQWDMRTYLIDFRVDVRDTHTNVLVGTARSFQTSLSAMGQSYQEIIESTVEVLLDGMGPRLEKQAETRERNKRRRRR